MPKVINKSAENLDQVVTLRMLRQELERFVTKDVLKRELKSELKRELKKALKNYPTKEDIRKEFIEYNTSLMEMLNDFKIEMMGEFKLIHEEIAALGYRQSEHSNQLDDHERRLVLLES